MDACDGLRTVIVRDTSNSANKEQTVQVKRAYECGALLLHAVAAEHLPEVNSMLQGVQHLFRAWQAVMVPNGYTALHLRTGSVQLPIKQGVSVASLPWSDLDMSSGRAPKWLAAQGSSAMAAFTKRRHKPVAIASDSALLVGLLQSRLWNSVRPMHCCVGAAHADKAKLRPEDD